MMGNNADAVAGTSDETKLIEELVKLKLTDPQMTNKELADKLEIPLKNCRQLIKKLRNSGKLEEAEQGAVKSSDKKTTNPVSSPKNRAAEGDTRGVRESEEQAGGERANWFVDGEQPGRREEPLAGERPGHWGGSSS